MKYFLFAISLLAGCSHKEFELEQIGEDVLKAKQGLEIDIKPIPKS
jgi:hypothetical protein